MENDISLHPGDARILQIAKRYGHKQVLSGASFSAQSGTCVGILGGAGGIAQGIGKLTAGE